MVGLSRKQAWMLVGGSAAMLASMATRRMLAAGWRATVDDEVPDDPGVRASWGQTVAWTAAAAASSAVAGLLARRTAELGMRRMTRRRAPR